MKVRRNERLKAILFTKNNVEEVVKFLNYGKKINLSEKQIEEYIENGIRFKSYVSEDGNCSEDYGFRVYVDEWIVMGSNRHFEACTKKEFEEEFEIVALLWKYIEY